MRGKKGTGRGAAVRVATTRGRTLYGQWVSLAQLLQFMKSKRFATEARTQAQDFMLTLKERAIRALEAQQFQGPGLTASTQKRKGHARAFYESGFYIRNVTLEIKQLGAAKFRIRVGPRNVKEPRTGEPLQKVAHWLEFGNRGYHVPLMARALWGPLYQEVLQMPQFRGIGKITMTKAVLATR